MKPPNGIYRRGVREISTFGSDAETPMRTLPSVVEIGASRWNKRLPVPPERVNPSPGRGPLSYHPVVHHDIVFVNDAEKIWAWNILTGEPAWPTEKGTAEVYLPEVVDGSQNRGQQSAGAPYFTMTIADGKLFARMGSSVTNPAKFETPPPPSDLICLDISTSQGKLVWKVASQELFKDGQKRWRFEGSPLVISGRVYVALSCFSQQLEFCVACLDGGNGIVAVESSDRHDAQPCRRQSQPNQPSAADCRSGQTFLFDGCRSHRRPERRRRPSGMGIDL